MSKRTLTRIASSVLAAAALSVGVTAPAAHAASEAKAGNGPAIIQKDTGWD